MTLQDQIAAVARLREKMGDVTSLGEPTAFFLAVWELNWPAIEKLVAEKGPDWKAFKYGDNQEAYAPTAFIEYHKECVAENENLKALVTIGEEYARANQILQARLSEAMAENERLKAAVRDLAEADNQANYPVAGRELKGACMKHAATIEADRDFMEKHKGGGV